MKSEAQAHVVTRDGVKELFKILEKDQLPTAVWHVLETIVRVTPENHNGLYALTTFIAVFRSYSNFVWQGSDALGKMFALWVDARNPKLKAEIKELMPPAEFNSMHAQWQGQQFDSWAMAQLPPVLRVADAPGLSALVFSQDDPFIKILDESFNLHYI